MKNLNTTIANNNQVLLLTLIQDAYSKGDYLLTEFLPGWEALAEDERGEEYLVWWKEREDWDGDDTGEACDWDKPDKVTDSRGYWVDPDTVVIM